ncbi:hypothetical protein QVL63_00145 [Bartonella henselae]|uniref:hypothetical protein n=1 Tax=Bartonella henselae TaxID=38323 RepID=UPI0004AF084F|nr:hypothetical protein [Bartonella henselae]MDM9984274.1 hypothetical protein [Bartonella henselae]MDM9994583.1 hypothetical protein [Bartonella henselae]
MGITINFVCEGGAIKFVVPLLNERQPKKSQMLRAFAYFGGDIWYSLLYGW